MPKNFANQTLHGRPFKEGDDLRDANFHKATLRGVNFESLDLSRADFSKADIRGANFSNTILVDANLSGAKAGLQDSQIVLNFIITFFTSVVLTLTSELITGGYVTHLFSEEVTKSAGLVPGTLSLIYIGVTYLAIAIEGFTTRTLSIIAVAFMLAVLGGVVFSGGGAGLFVLSGSGAVVVAITVAILVAFSSMSLGAAIFTLLGFVTATIKFSGHFVGIGAFSTLVPFLLLSFYIYWQVSKENPRFAVVREFGIAFECWRGTDFRGSDLSRAVVINASLISANFNASKDRPTNLSHVDWSRVEGLNQARLGGSILTNRAIRELLVTRRGHNKDYSKANLSGANLKGVDLTQANLTRADLSNALLYKTCLKDANLREAIALGANFSGAYLTGACIEGWNIDHTTILDDVDCQFIFLLEKPNEFGNRDRRPHDPDKIFQPGDFEKLYRKVISTMQILLRDGINPKAFATAFQKVMAKFSDITPNSIQAIEKKDRDILLTIQVPVKSDPGKIEQEFCEVYQPLSEEQKETEKFKLNKLPLNLNIIVGDNTTMTDNKNQGITAGEGNFINTATQTLSNSPVNVSSTLTNSLNQLQSASHPNASELAALLKQLQTAIKADTDLSPDDQAEALEQVSTLVQAGQNPQDAPLKKEASIAVKVIKGTIAVLPSTATLVKACSDLLPAITKLLGL